MPANRTDLARSTSPGSPAAPNAATKSTAVNSVTTWALHPGRDGRMSLKAHVGSFDWGLWVWRIDRGAPRRGAACTAYVVRMDT